ncbi:hypothetical protein L1987_11255 [Smallanthus sonchifolius]|uniref:Uncharacterized protein n=1 Tax=Smallanthus sonchifolius TaxID=185202 RepID=A0ACB9JAF7_9ASTR|nr:hypothetical protein L1987_11255 [Smallanthus sonchifolius]
MGIRFWERKVKAVNEDLEGCSKKRRRQRPHVLTDAYILSPSTFTMDWQGQKVAEQLMQIMLVVFAIAAFITGYILGSFELMIYVYAGGVVLTILTTIPNWPFFNRHPLKWLDPSEAEKHPKPQVTSSVSKKKTPKK